MKVLYTTVWMKDLLLQCYTKVHSKPYMYSISYNT